MTLTRQERQRILAGHPAPLVRDRNPKLEKGDQLVVTWSRPSRRAIEDGFVFDNPERPVVWITVSKVVRRTDGRWSVRYDITDRRDAAFYLAPKTGYTTDPLRAVDRGEVPLSERDRKRLATDARASHVERQAQSRERSEAQARAQIRSVSEMLRKLAVDAAREGTDINPLLAAIVRQIKEDRRAA